MKEFAVGKAFNLDCLELFDILEKDKIEVDAIITDPPYNISRENNFSTIGRSGIDFGEWDYEFDQALWIKKSVKLLKNGGSIIIFNDWKNMGDIAKTLEECGLAVKDLIRWKKTNPMPRNTERRYVTDFEFALWAVKPKGTWTFNKPENIPYLRPEYSGGLVLGKDRVHPTQKDQRVIEDILKVHTNEGDLILEPFLGGGTTAIACQNTGRRFVASELEKKYFDKACERIGENEK